MREGLRAVTEQSVESKLGRLHLLLGVQSLVVILVSVNRLSSLTLGYVASNEFLRWVDFHNMLTLPLISILAFYLLKKQLEQNPLAGGERWQLALNVVFLIGVYLLGASYGNHEITNYLHTRFCLEGGPGPICNILIFNDDEFSHWLFFTGFVCVNATLMLLQALFPFRKSLTAGDQALFVFNSLFIGAGVVANLAFETIGLDLFVVGLLAILALVLLWRRGAQPLLIYYSAAYSFGLVVTVLLKGSAVT